MAGTPGGDAALFAYLSYRDAPAALEWLTTVGFEVVTLQDGPDGPTRPTEARPDPRRREHAGLVSS
ncbi:hypothetical protein GCM10010472_53800 [Pseudonocardia halophobica]|uniref:Uncharacterized protein n=1 Tax=Pseudonocardia halophobica TaxID=29401 RepID=A0A9W6NW29_9PSEU|nr:hypothetical protein GCM10017577_26000 [Pseudonocardia halophobica]